MPVTVISNRYWALVLSRHCAVHFDMYLIFLRGSSSPLYGWTDWTLASLSNAQVPTKAKWGGCQHLNTGNLIAELVTSNIVHAASHWHDKHDARNHVLSFVPLNNLVKDIWGWWDRPWTTLLNNYFKEELRCRHVSSDALATPFSTRIIGSTENYCSE